jgi:triphosphoribosyl-dephospho-CoA synthase
MNSQNISSQLATAFQEACIAELTALKPGNVHIFADGHGMVVHDFIKSAEAAAKVIAQPNISVGQRILMAVDATWDAVGCNTNLGIILLAAPLIQAALNNDQINLKASLQKVLLELTIDDAKLAYQAILRANPAGLGTTQQHDVHTPPSVTLLAAMQAAQDRDLIARQYANGYHEIFEFGINCYQQALAQWQRPAWAATVLYLGFLANFKDSHIARKHGDVLAIAIQDQAKIHQKALLKQDVPRHYQRELMNFDADLKARGLNPGTSADLTVATLLVQTIAPEPGPSFHQ